MKRIVLILGLLLLAAHPALAQDSTGMRIPSYVSDLTVNTDASLDVKETITAQFDTEHHGIFRIIPQTATFNGQKVHLPISDVQVLQDATTAIFTQTTDSKNVVTVKIGDPNELLLDKHIYVISYHVVGAVNFFSDFDELNWNVTGNDWAFPLGKTSATLHLPSTSVTPTGLCYTGPPGSTAQDCTFTTAPGAAIFSANDTLTIVSHWTKGFITKPADYDHIRQSIPTREWMQWLGWAAAILFPLLTLGFLWNQWRSAGRDPAESKTLMVQYEPPTDVRPAEALAIFEESVNSRAHSSTIVDLAVRGYLQIQELEHAEFMGLGHRKDYALIAKKPADDTLRPYERDMLSALFDDEKNKDDQGRTLLSLMRRHQAQTATVFRAIQGQITAGVTERGYFMEDPRKTRAKYTGVGGAFLAVAYITFRISAGAGGGFNPLLIFAISLGVTGALIMAFGYIMPRRSELGAKTHWQLKGFRLFLTTAEKYRLQWQEKQNIFETYLPYAMVFGVAQKWSKTFADLNLPASSWYVGSGGTWSSIYAWTAISNFNTAFAAAASPPSSGGSAGGSGGGGGGGGGGGW